MSVYRTTGPLVLSYCPFKILILQICKCDFSKSIMARDLKLYQLKEHDSKIILVQLMTSISKGKNTPIVLNDKISLILKLINYAILFRLSSLPKSVASYCKKGR